MEVLLVTRIGALLPFLRWTGTGQLVAGGIAYLIGLLFYVLGSHRERMHGVFHLLCLAGSTFHCVCAGLFVI